jgi:HAMP domain-containing protein
LFFLSLNNATTAVIDDSGVTFSAESTIASLEAALDAVRQELQTLPPAVDYTEDILKLRREHNIQPSAEVGELQQQINTLRQEVQTQRQPELGSMAPLQQNNLPWVAFDTTPESVPTTTGTVAWAGGTTLGIQMTANVLQRVGESQYFYIKADSTITKGQLIMFTGAVGASGVIKGAPATGLTDGQYLMGVAAENIAANGFGLVTSFGNVRGWNTTGSPVGETWVDGDILYYNPSIAGGLTKTQPTAPNVKATIAVVVNAAPAGSGDVFVRVSTGSVLGGTDSNVQFGTLATNDLIQYNGTIWTNVTPASVINSSGGAPVTKTANFSVAAGETWLINNKSGSSCTVTLPTPSTNTGRVLHFQNYQAQTLVSASSNVVPLAGGSATTAILEAVAGANATLVSDGTNWIMTQYDSNNALQLE